MSSQSLQNSNSNLSNQRTTAIPSPLPWPAPPTWNLFRLAPSGEKADLPRSLDTLEGIGDRLRSAAFAEIQARDAFHWATQYFATRETLPQELLDAWTELAHAEQKHLLWLLDRMDELGLRVQDRRVSDQLWLSLVTCTSAKEFTHFMASAEERGRRAGLRFHEALLKKDPVTATIFGKIAEEEISHIALAQRFFPIDSSPSDSQSQGIWSRFQPV